MKTGPYDDTLARPRDSAPPVRAARPMRAATRHLLAVCGFILVGIGALGVVLPVLPTTPFLIAAAACFSRCSPRFEAWLVNHPAFGPSVQAWRRHRAIPKKAKLLAVTAMLLSYAVLLASGARPLVLVVVAISLLACGSYVLSRPSA